MPSSHPQMKQVSILNPNIDAASYNQAVLDCERLLRSYAEECCGGSGQGGETYLSAARNIRAALLISDQMVATRNINRR